MVGVLEIQQAGPRALRSWAINAMTLCPWKGLPCHCVGFPWLQNDTIPAACEDGMADELLGRRKVTEAGKERYRAYLAEVERNRRKNGSKT